MKPTRLLVRAIIVRNRKVLVNQNTGPAAVGAYCALPGGHVEPGETCVAALHREIAEELAREAIVGELRAVIENRYPGRKLGEGTRAELQLYFDCELLLDGSTDDDAVPSPEPNKRFRWLPLQELESANLLPVHLRALLQQPATDAAYWLEDRCPG